MRIRTVAVIGCLLLSAALASITAAPKLFLTLESVGEVVISVDPSLHQEYGLAYPVTYKFVIPAGSTNLVAYQKHLQGATWIPFIEKTSSDFFNGIEAIRFDYTANEAYVSVGFDSTSDDIFLRVTDWTGQPVNIQFQGICRYYDNRQSVVTLTADDWKEYTNLDFVNAVHTLRSYNLPVTVAIITGGCTTNTWHTIQAELDSGLVEAASHTRSHVDPPYPDPISEIVGSKQDILTNLNLPPLFRKGSQGYVYAWIAPYGSTTAQTEVIVGQAQYIIDRMTFTSNGNFTPWDTTQLRYVKDGKTAEMGPLWGGLTDASALNNLFNQSLAGGTIYHLILHPFVLDSTNEWSKPYIPRHLSYISNRVNVWYVNFGALYIYHLLQDDAPGTIQVASGAPTITQQPTDVTARQHETAMFSVTATGSAPLSYQWQRNGFEVAGATNAIYTTPTLTQADSNTIYRCTVTNGLGTATSTTATLLVLPPIINVLTNASFESGTAPWVFWTNGSGTMTQAPFGTDSAKSAQLSISVSGTDVQLYQANVKLQPNTDYKLSFDAYSNTGHDLDVSLNKNVSPYTNYGLSARKFDLGTTWQNFSVGFTTSGFSNTVTDGRLWFSLAAYNAAGDVYYIDHVMLAKVSDLDPSGSIPPAITMQPLSQTVMAGQTATFSVTATGTAPLTYQWQRNSMDIAGATNYTYTTPVTTAADSGSLYRCHVSNSAGSVTSDTARLLIIAPKPPAITAEPRDTTVLEGTPVQFVVVATGDTLLAYQWQRNSADIAGATTPSYLLVSASRTDSGATFRCIVSNSAGKDTSRDAMLSVRPLPPTQLLASPASGSINLAVSPVLAWHPTARATFYQLQVSVDSAFATGLLVNDSTVTDTSYQVRGLAYTTRYFWHVKPIGTGGQYSTVWSFSTVMGPAATPALLSPVNGTAGLAVVSIDFVWQSSPWASRYRLQVATDSTFVTGVAYDDSTLSDTAKSLTMLHTDQRYYWHVSAKGVGGSADFSSVWSFETVKTAPLAAPLIYPANGATAVPVVGLTFRWDNVPSAIRYGFQLGTDSTFTAGLFTNDTALVDTVRTVSGLAMATHYFWRVRARNSAEWGEYSPVWSMTTQLPVPGQVALIGPQSGGLGTADSCTFTWHRSTPAAAHYWFEISVDSAFASFRIVDSTLTDTMTVFRPMENGRWYYWRVRGGDLGGWGPYSETWKLHVLITTITEKQGLPQSYVLEQNHPNPFNPSTKIGFSLPRASVARLDIFNMLGEKVATVLNEHMEPGYYSVTFDASALASGVYLCRLVTDSGALVRKMILMK
jgi:peptidoglycan/xylan/chitin deacetylase (PgdA/CDA1 family)